MEVEEIPDWMEPFHEDDLAPVSYRLEKGASCGGDIEFDRDISGDWVMP